MVNKRWDLAPLLDNKPLLLKELLEKGYTQVAQENHCWRQSVVWAAKDFPQEEKDRFPIQRKRSKS